MLSHDSISSFANGAARTIALAVVTLLSSAELMSAPQVDADGTVHVSAFALLESSPLSEEARAGLKVVRESSSGLRAASKVAFAVKPPADTTDRAAMAGYREAQAEIFHKTPFYQKLCNMYPIVMAPQKIAGVYVEIFTPKDGIASHNQDRVLINLHGGHLIWGGRIVSHLESIPVASIGKIKVISIDYRMAPEYAFPAASEDVAAVYRELLKTYKPENIGIYGGSAGGLLTAESIAWLLNDGLPLRGAIAMRCGAAGYHQDGDSAIFASAVDGFPLDPVLSHPYFKGIVATDPLAFPIYSPKVMVKFPPSLLVSASRDMALSSVVFTHLQLIKMGVEAELLVWEGLGHCFFDDPDQPNSRDAQDALVRFFDRHLGRPAQVEFDRRN
jgi:acetyl esterase/lipase